MAITEQQEAAACSVFISLVYAQKITSDCESTTVSSNE